MLFELNAEKNLFTPISGVSISQATGGSEKDLENYLKAVIGDILFPEYLVFGNERSFQGEADLFAVNGRGDLVLFELKVHGQYDRGKVYQAMSYAQIFSMWRYDKINSHFKKCFSGEGNLAEAFNDHFGYSIDQADFNKRQKIIVISHSSSPETSAVTKYWKSLGLDIEEYYYRFYNFAEKTFVEISNELFFQQDSGSCWINTCEKHISGAVFNMVLNKKAAIYEERKGVVGSWMNKADIFLYHNGFGIVAAGRGTATIIDEYNNDLKVEERAVRLKNFICGVDAVKREIVRSVKPHRIRELLNRDFYFPNSIVTLSKDEGEKLREECQAVFV